MKNYAQFFLYFLLSTKITIATAQQIEGVEGKKASPIKASFNDVLLRESKTNFESIQNNQDFSAPNASFISPSNSILGDYGPILPVDSSLLLPSIDTVLTFTGQLSDNAIIPGDPKGAVSPNYVITATNERITFHNSSGTVLSSVTDESFWVNQDATGSRLSIVCSTPYYDKQNNRFFIFAQNGQNLQLSNILIAISETENPLGNWNFYKFKTNANDLTKSTHGILLGYNKDWFLVSTQVGAVTNDERPGESFMFYGNRIFAFPAANLRNNSSVTPVVFNIEDITLHPAQVNDINKSTISLVGISSSAKAQYSLYEFRGANPVLNHITEISLGNKNGWIYKPSVNNTLPQKNMTYKTNGLYGVGGIGENIVERGKNLWVVHPVYFSTDGSNSNSSTFFSGIQWVKIDTKDQWIADWGRLIDTTTMMYSGFRVSKNSFEYPSIAVNEMEDVVIVFNHFSPNVFPSVGYTVRLHNENYFRKNSVLRHGKSKYFKTYSTTINRWGYNSYITLDPANNKTFWLLGQYAETPNTEGRWGAAWGKVIIP